MKITGLLTIAKFFKNPRQNKRAKKQHPVITRTMKKIGFVASEYDKQPQGGEFWIVRIRKVLRTAFLLEPIEKIEDPKTVLKLIPGFYTVTYVGNTVVVNPKKGGKWILPKALKKSFGYVDAVIVRYLPEEDNITVTSIMSEFMQYEAKNAMVSSAPKV